MMKNGPLLWDAILERFPKDAIIAGGAVRDYLLGVEPKDIDVFYKMPEPNEPPDPDWTLASIKDADDPRPAGLDRIDDRYERHLEYEAVSNIALVSSGELFGYKVDAIELTEFEGGQQLIEGFDFGITRCYYTNDGWIHTSSACRRDIDNKKVTLLLGDRRDRAFTRFHRFNERMNGAFTLVQED